MSKNNPHLIIGPNALVCLEADVQGKVTIGARSVVHPKARIIAQDGPIIIGENNLIEEQALIINKKLPGETEAKPMIIGDHNVFEVGSVCETRTVGSNNVLETKAKVGPLTRLSNGCVIGALSQTNIDEELGENIIVCGENNYRRKMADKPSSQSQQLDFLRNILPNYHYLNKGGGGQIIS